MELSCSNINFVFLYFRKRKPRKILYILGNGTSLYLSYISGSNFPSSKNEKSPFLKKLAMKKFLIFSQKKLFLYLRKRNLLISPKLLRLTF